jgi:hypothetical protein
MNVEIDYANAHDIPVYTIKQLDQYTVWLLQHEFTDLLMDKFDTPITIKIGDSHA